MFEKLRIFGFESWRIRYSIICMPSFR